MTLVQASIAEKGNAVILTSDRLLTRYISRDLPPYEFESETPKIIALPTAAMGFAGSELHANSIISLIHEGGGKLHFKKAVELVCKYIEDTRRNEIEKEIKRRTGIENAMDFFTKSDLPIPNEVRENIYIMMGERREPIVNCQCILAGFDEKMRARIIVIDEVGDAFDLTHSGMAAIGSGAPFSIIFFDQYNYNTDMAAEDALYFAFEAKKWSEAPRGVGKRTDMILILKDKDGIKIKKFYDGCKVLNKMEEFYQNKRKLMAEKQKNLKEEINKILGRK